jgi:hypothetical protein
MSGLNAQAKGLSDARSALFWEIPRIWKLAVEAWPYAEVAVLVENAESKYLQGVSDALGSGQFERKLPRSVTQEGLASFGAVFPC